MLSVGFYRRVRHRQCCRNNFCFSRWNRACITLDICDNESLGLGKCTRWPFCDLDPRAQLWHQLTKMCISHPITTKAGSDIVIVKLDTWWNSVRHILGEFPPKLWMWPFQHQQNVLAISLEWLVQLTWNDECIGWIMGQLRDLNLRQWPWASIH